MRNWGVGGNGDWQRKAFHPSKASGTSNNGQQ